MSTCDIMKLPVKLGSGSITNGSASVTGFTLATGSRQNVGVGRNVQVKITSSTDNGKEFAARIIADDGTSLTLSIVNPFAT